MHQGIVRCHPCKRHNPEKVRIISLVLSAAQIPHSVAYTPVPGHK